MENYYAYKRSRVCGRDEKFKGKKNVPIRHEIAACNLANKKEKKKSYYYCCENIKGNGERKGGKWCEVLQAFSLPFSFSSMKRKEEETLCQRELLLALKLGLVEWETFYDYYTDIIMLFSRLVRELSASFVQEKEGKL